MTWLALPAFSQDVTDGTRDVLFGDIEARVAEARAKDVPLLAPRGFAEAVADLERAAEDFERGRNLNRIQERIAEAAATLSDAEKAAEIARLTLEATLRTRTDAMTSAAAEHAPEAWSKAEERFFEAATDVERGDMRSAQRHGAEAEVLYRAAELAAIKGSLLGEARALIARAQEERVERWAPRTLESAQRFLAQAEEAIERNRYEQDLPRSLAQQASYEARHAVYLAGLIRTVEDRDHGIEELILAWEAPLRQMASELGVDPAFDQGFEPALEALLETVQQRAADARRLDQELGERESQVNTLTREIERLESQLGGASQERIALQRRVDAQAALRANLATIEGMFAPDEARVLREGDDVVLRLMGLNFPVGRATIEASSIDLLARVQQAIRMFPGAAIVIEGHTDSYGSDSANFILSQDRADAVRQYLISNMGLDAERVSSIGYGETRPVATNDTAEGRARNRRIDLVLRLDPAQLQ
ncbi:MAG TPA: OmpA family protein [Steroidobacteraceae bacterium]|nr:OmpA family protein [Steroidobacteraceae bacterium]